MKGKKSDSEFIGEFILECVRMNLETTDLMANRAKMLINEIDEEIKKVEKKKILRSKLLDVVYLFDKKEKIDKSKDIKILSFFQIKNVDICKFICKMVSSGYSVSKILSHNKYDNPDILFCIKQLIEHKILFKSGDFLTKSSMFDDYMKFLEKDI